MAFSANSPNFVPGSMAIYTVRAQAEELAQLMTAMDWAPGAFDQLLTAAEASHAKIGEALAVIRSAQSQTQKAA
jgi:hypothetical protein